MKMFTEVFSLHHEDDTLDDETSNAHFKPSAENKDDFIFSMNAFNSHVN